MVPGQILVHSDTLEHRVDEDADLVVRRELFVEEMESGGLGLDDAPAVVEGEIEKEEELPRRFQGGGGRGRVGRVLPDRPGFGSLFRRSLQAVLLEVRQDDRPAVVGDRKILERQVFDGLALLVRDVDVDELEGDRDFVLERFRQVLPSRGGGDGRRRRGKENEEAEEAGRLSGRPDKTNCGFRRHIDDPLYHLIPVIVMALRQDRRKPDSGAVLTCSLSGPILVL
jgi:hypothetical protein